MHDYYVEVIQNDMVSPTFVPPVGVIEVAAGSNYLEVIEQGPQGPPGPKGDRGENGSAGSSYSHHQTTPAATWIVDHNLSKRPDVVLLLDDDPLTRVWTDLHYIDANTVSIEFPTAVSGWAYL